MCGIAGLVEFEARAVPQDLLRQMSEQMRMRGPDASGVWSRNQIGFAHRRLRVIDLDPRSDQPMLNALQDLCIVFNGEIYNYLDLREELKKKGRSFRTDSDTEVVLQAYEEWGLNSFSKFNGMFSIAIADFKNPQKPSLILARDRFGIKPLYYSMKNGQFAFASEVRAMMQVPWISQEIDPQTLFWYLKFSHVPNPQSILKMVSQLQPGHWIKLEEGQITQDSFWKWTLGSEHARSKLSDQEWLSETSEVLSRAVKRQMISAVPVGCFLSGGVDSSILVSEAVKINPQIETFTVGYSEKEFDETSFAQKVAHHFNAKFNPILLTPESVENWITRLPDLIDQPLADPTMIPMLILCQEARKKVTVALSGDGGDEMFFGYRYQEVLWWLFPMTKLPVKVKNALFSRLRRLLYSLQKPELNQWIKALDVLQFRSEAELFQNFTGTFGPIPLSSLREMIHPDLRERIEIFPSYFQKYLQDFNEESWSERIEAIFIRTFLVDTVLAKSDRCGMAFGLEVRVPFLDHEVLELSRRMPFGQKYKLFETKHILRKRLAQDLPRELSHRPKRGFSIPIRDWMRGPLKPMLDHYLNKKRIEAEGLFDSVSVDTLMKEHQSGVMNHSHLIWSILTFELWNERYRGGRR